MTRAPLVEGDPEVLTLTAAGERLALAAPDILEILRPRPLTRVPNAPASLLGVANVRGRVLPVLSLAALLDRQATDVSPASRIVVVNKGGWVGLMVDEVFALTRGGDERRVDIDVLLARDFGAMLRRAGGRAPPPARNVSAMRSAAADAGALSLITFTLANQEYALPLDKVVEIMALPSDVAKTPGTDPAMIGVTDLRGRLLPLVALRVLLGLKASDGRQSFVVVTRLAGALAGLVVDGLGQVLLAPPEAVDAPPPVLTRGKSEARIDAICRLDGGRRLVSILSPARIFDDETASRIMAGAESGGARMETTKAQSEDARQFVIFTLGGELYGLPIACVNEVVRRPDRLTRVPHAPAFVAGVMNLRGRVVPVIDQRQRFAAPAAKGTAAGRIVIVTMNGVQAGFAVDAVSEVLTLSSAELNPAPELSTESAQIFDRIATIERYDRMILLIDPKALLDQAEQDLLMALAANQHVVTEQAPSAA